MNAIMKTFVRSDGKRRLQIVKRNDGFYSLSENVQALAYDGELCWTPAGVSQSGSFGIFDTMETAEFEARARVGWLTSSN
jgi:hypothetical protein